MDNTDKRAEIVLIPNKTFFNLFILPIIKNSKYSFINF